MAERTTKYFQKCDFCHKEFEVSKDGMSSITLPGYYIPEYGSLYRRWITADICDECINKLRERLARIVDIKEVAYGGTIIHWLDDEGENKGEKNDG